MKAAQLDTALFRLINNLPHTGWLDALVIKIANIQQKEACAALVAAFVLGLILRKHGVWQSAVVLFVAFLFLDPLVMGMKPEFNRPRPAETLQNVHLIGSQAHGSSFPSSQAALASLLFVYLCLADRKRWALWLGVTLLVGFFRVYQGVHYPGDILGGWLLGSGSAIAVFFLYRSLLKGYHSVFPKSEKS